MIVGLTGGIGSGKSVAGDFFIELGIDVIDADHVSKNILDDNESAKKLFLEHFGEKFIDNTSVCLILGDNIFYGSGFTKILQNSVSELIENKKAKVFGFYVNNPSRYGVVEYIDDNVVSIEEKPLKPKSNYAVVGLYFYPPNVVEIAKKIKPSQRGELEITSINTEYLKEEQLKVELLDKSFTWLDSGTHESMLEASNFIHTIEKRTGLKIACVEEIAFKLGYINSEQFEELIKSIGKNQYGSYLESILNGI